MNELAGWELAIARDCGFARTPFDGEAARAEADVARPGSAA